jgi:hypothetical protein
MSSYRMQTLLGRIGELNIKKTFRDVLARNSARGAFRAAMAQAYTSCGRHYYPKWASYFLDPEFQAPGESRLRACYVQGLACMGPAELARFWADQMLWTSEAIKLRHVAELVPVAERFLRCLALELCDRKELQPKFDCAAWGD